MGGTEREALMNGSQRNNQKRGRKGEKVTRKRKRESKGDSAIC